MVEYQPILTKAYKDGILPGSYYATFEDRIAMYQSRKQLYGTQTTYNSKIKKSELWPIEDERNVNKRRSEMRMEPLAQYLKRLGIDYNSPL
jgi:hypothetical protein